MDQWIRFPKKLSSIGGNVSKAIVYHYHNKPSLNLPQMPRINNQKTYVFSLLYKQFGINQFTTQPGGTFSPNGGMWPLVATTTEGSLLPVVDAMVVPVVVVPVLVVPVLVVLLPVPPRPALRAARSRSPFRVIVPTKTWRRRVSWEILYKWVLFMRIPLQMGSLNGTSSTNGGFDENSSS